MIVFVHVDCYANGTVEKQEQVRQWVLDVYKASEEAWLAVQRAQAEREHAATDSLDILWETPVQCTATARWRYESLRISPVCASRLRIRDRMN
eukprot:206138-Pleurochrysis_carterae.AAC.2